MSLSSFYAIDICNSIFPAFVFPSHRWAINHYSHLPNMFNPFNVSERGSSVPPSLDFVTQFSTQMSKFNLWLRFGEF